MGHPPTGIVGAWRVDISTPIGTMTVSMEFTERGGVLAGIARGRGEDVALECIAVSSASDGEVVTWTQAITKPLRLNLEFDVTVTGDTLIGTSHAGRLPRSKVRGRRVAGDHFGR